MKLQEKHKEFAVKCFARFMTRTQVVEAFIEEFADDLPPPPEISQLPQVQIDMEILEEQLGREEDIAGDLEWYQERYEDLYGTKAKEKFEADSEKIRAEIEAERPLPDQSETAQEHYEEHQKEVEKHNERVKRKLSSQLRRLNMTHCQFPEKYRDLFNQARREYFSSYQSENLQNSENVAFELETLYGYVKQRIFTEGDPKEAMQQVPLAHQILKTLIACNALEAEQQIVDVTPQDVKAIKKAQKSEQNA